KIVVIDKRLSEPHMYVAFYMQIDPRQYQEWSKGLQAYRGNVGFVDQMDEYSLGKYFFTTNFQEKPELLNSDYVLAGKPEEFGEIVPDHIVKYPDDTDAIYVTNLQKEGFALNNN